MPSTNTDRIGGLSTSVAIKAPCLYTTTGNITLSGLAVQANGEWTATLTDNDRIFAKDQTNPIDNGIWEAGAGTWQRAKDFDGSRDVVQGTLISVYAGASYGGTLWKVTTDNPIYIGTTSLAFQLSNTLVGASDVGKVVDSIAALKALDKTEVTRAFVTGYHAAGDGGGGHYWYDPSDTTSTDNGGTVIVASDGGRWKLASIGGYVAAQFGATGTADDSAYIENIIDSGADRVVFGAGNHAIGTDLTLTVPAVFLPGAYVTIATGVTLTINDTIDSVRQHIFRGAGDVLLNYDPSHAVYPQWFGAFSSDGGSGVDCSAELQKLSDSVVAGRECLIDFDAGIWYLGAAVSWSRACRLLGAGERLTHFRCLSSFLSGNVFTTSGQGVTFENIQFSTDGTRTSGYYISLEDAYCRALNIWYTDAFCGIDVQANDCEVDKVTCFVNSTDAGTHIVRLGTSTFRGRVDKIIYVGTAAQAPQDGVFIGGAQRWHIGSVRMTAAGRTPVSVLLGAGTAAEGQIDQISIAVDGATYTADAAFVMQTTSTAGIKGIRVDSIVASGLDGHAVQVIKGGSGDLAGWSIGSISSSACAGAIAVSATSGTVDDWSVNSGHAIDGTGVGYSINNATGWSLSSVVAKGCAGLGFDIGADTDQFSITGTKALSNDGGGTTIASGADNFVYTGNINQGNTSTQLTDNSGGVTKAVANNI